MPGTSVPTPHAPPSRRSRPLVRNAAVVALRSVLALAVAAVAWNLQLEPLGAVVTLFVAWATAHGACVLGWALPTARRGERDPALLLAGASGVVAGAAALTISGLDVHGFVWLLAGWSLALGVTTLGAVSRLAGRGRAALLTGGAIAVVWGLALLLWPVAGPGTLARWIAALALGLGIADAALAARLFAPAHGARGEDG